MQIIPAEKLSRESFTLTDLRVVRQLWTSHRAHSGMGSPRRLAGLLFYHNCHGQYWLPDGRAFCCDPGDVVYLPLASEYRTEFTPAGIASNKEPATTIVCNFTLRLDDGTPFGLSAELRRFPPSKDSRQLFLALAEIWHQPLPDLLRAKACLYQLFAVLCSHEKHQVLASGPFADIAPAIQYLEEELIQEKSIGELAAMCHVSVSKFRQLFHAYAGMAPTVFRIASKLERAKLLLEFDRSSIAEIADQLGFGDPAYFSRLFKKYCGVAPQSYRQGME
ncbi:AraC family transcriptional regulator [Oligosphaera ethanolica]|jgi:AraC-like DNA-binding protein|uniref:AraC-like DNA-binding protein n=1 Tax=Oligosphaera ethanolica TaxID=760260 RepID=A0AAE4AP28_9BACT|nr:AraC family transcriptional regulator [Oligosphaera ethanolica]MDQ0290080.1 AraC-like DNA-binding protein [Oligosphaera ethanolica]